MYNGWKQVHCIKFHSLIAPDGLHIHVFGPIEGRCHDETLYKQSGLEILLEKHFRDPNGKSLYIYGDPAYGEHGPIISGLKRVETLSEADQDLNTTMAKYRECVEWAIGKISVLWRQFDLSYTNRIFRSSIGIHYLVAVILTNVHSIMYGSQTQKLYNFPPPSLDEYFV